jgi:hypothetical protein
LRRCNSTATRRRLSELSRVANYIDGDLLRERQLANSFRSSVGASIVDDDNARNIGMAEV